MYDLYDSVDDDEFEKYSEDSLENIEYTFKSITSFDNGPTLSSEPFRLHKEKYFPLKPTDLQCQKLFQENGGYPKLMWNCDMDEDVLISKGLQMKEDGSFCQSPREQLPFIMPASKIAQIRWKKESLAKRNSQNYKSWNEFKRGGSLGNIADCVQTSSDEISRLKTRENMTDSMKEALYKTYKKNAGKRTFFLPKFQKPDLIRCVDGKQKSEESVRKSKTNKSEFKLPFEQKKKLSYYERYQKKQGFHPESISKRECKPPNDSVRSIFGDLTRRDTLSEVSGDFVFDEVDDSEESFYDKVIAREKLKTEKNRSRVKGEVEERRKEEVKCTKTSASKTKKNRSDTVRPPVTNNSSTVLSGRKSHRLCATNPESLPKGELASKAKAYGNLANTRNMAKLQMKSLKEDKNRTSSTPSSELSDVQKKKSENSGCDTELWEWKSFLPRLVVSGKREVELPWETRNLLMQISAERHTFNANIKNLKSRIATRERMWFEKEFGCREAMART